MLEEHVLDVSLHDRASFHCGVPVLDDYLHKYAAQQNAKGLNTAFLLVDSAVPGKILGFYTLSDTERKCSTSDTDLSLVWMRQ